MPHGSRSGGLRAQRVSGRSRVSGELAGCAPALRHARRRDAGNEPTGASGWPVCQDCLGSSSTLDGGCEAPRSLFTVAVRPYQDDTDALGYLSREMSLTEPELPVCSGLTRPAAAPRSGCKRTAGPTPPPNRSEGDQRRRTDRLRLLQPEQPAPPGTVAPQTDDHQSADARVTSPPQLRRALSPAQGRWPRRRATYRSADRRTAVAPSRTTTRPHQPPYTRSNVNRSVRRAISSTVASSSGMRFG